jgi:IS5 family transposase
MGISVPFRLGRSSIVETFGVNPSKRKSPKASVFVERFPPSAESIRTTSTPARFCCLPFSATSQMFAKVRYRGLDKNAHRLFATAALANLFIIRHRLRCA